MDWDLYRRLIDDIARLGDSRVRLNRCGESLLYPRFVEAVRYAKQAGIRHVGVVTNGTLLERKLTHDILDSGIDEIVVSLDTLDRDTYESLRPGARLEEVTANVDRLIAMRQERGGSRPRIQISSVVVKEDVDQIGALFERYRTQVEAIMLRPCARYGQEECLPQDGMRARRWVACPQPWQRLSVFWNGDATVCVGDIEGELVVGNVARDSLEELWLKSPRAREIRRLHFRLDFGSLPVCRRCDGTNADFFEQGLRQLKRLYAAVGEGDRLVGLRNAAPLLAWPRARGAAKATLPAPASAGTDEFEP